MNMPVIWKAAKLTSPATKTCKTTTSHDGRKVDYINVVLDVLLVRSQKK